MEPVGFFYIVPCCKSKAISMLTVGERVMNLYPILSVQAVVVSVLLIRKGSDFFWNECCWAAAVYSR